MELDLPRNSRILDPSAPLAAARHMSYGYSMSSLLLSASTARTGPASALALILGGLLLLRLART